jgi:hypothetical protein
MPLPLTVTDPDTLDAPALSNSTPPVEKLSEAMLTALVTNGPPWAIVTSEVVVGSPPLQSPAVVQFAVNN